MTRPPAASIRPAAAITSMTMNGCTSLRAEGAIRRLAFSSILKPLALVWAGPSRPGIAAFGRLSDPPVAGGGGDAVPTCRVERNGRGSPCRQPIGHGTEHRQPSPQADETRLQVQMIPADGRTPARRGR